MKQLDDRWDTWECAKCYALKVVKSVPHIAPRCCGTGMWFQRTDHGKVYEVEPLTVEQ